MGMDAVFKMKSDLFNYRVAGIWILDGHILLHKNVTDEHWALPGGRVEVMEESKVGLHREFQEELAVDVYAGRLIWIIENFFHYNEQHYHELGFYYLVTSNNHYEWRTEAFPGAEGDKQLVYKWVPLSELNTVYLFPEFLKQGLRDLPNQTQHVVVK